MSTWIISDELNHYGVKGMKWGVRKDERYISAKNRYKDAKRASNTLYNKAYKFSARHPITQFIKGTKNYNESNKLWGDVHDNFNKEAKAKQNVKDTKKFIKAEKYRDKLSRKAAYKSEFYKQSARDNKSALDDLNKRGRKSDAYRDALSAHITMKETEASLSGRTYNGQKALKDILEFESTGRTRIKELRDELNSEYNSDLKNAKTWADRSKALRNTSVSSLTTKKDIKKIYKGK